jgi:SAM-dependent methyltransferase
MPGVEWHEEWHVGSGRSTRLEQEFRYLSRLVTRDTRSILDVGGASFFEKFNGASPTYDMIDLEHRLATGAGGYNAHSAGSTYNGETLPFEPLTYDIVIIGFVLHHAAQNTLSLLKQVHAIARSDILILEDLASPLYPRSWLLRNASHQPGGMFRDDKEWRQLFELLSFGLERAIIVRRRDDPDDKPYRALYHLKPKRL